MFVLSCILRWINYIAVVNVADMWICEYAVLVVVSWMLFCCMLIVVTLVDLTDVRDVLHADIC